jgi:hypothetical protein
LWILLKVPSLLPLTWQIEWIRNLCRMTDNEFTLWAWWTQTKNNNARIWIQRAIKTKVIS